MAAITSMHIRNGLLKPSHAPPRILEEAPSKGFSRRSIMKGVLTGTILRVFADPQQCIAAGKRRAPPPQQKKPEEDKSLSAYDAKLLATARRKEAMKSALEKQKAKGKFVVATET